MPATNLPDKVADHSDELVVYEPPTAFEVVSRGSGEIINFAAHGDSFVGIYEGTEEVVTEDGEQLLMANFTGANARPYVIFPNPVLRRGLKKLEQGQWCRITYLADIDTGKPSPLKSYVVEVGKA